MMLSRRAMLLSIAATAAAVGCSKRPAGPLSPDEPVDTGFSGCSA
jgi:hypothetical protein